MGRVWRRCGNKFDGVLVKVRERENGSGWLGLSAWRTYYRHVCGLGHCLMLWIKELLLGHTVKQRACYDMLSASCGVAKLWRVSQMGGAGLVWATNYEGQGGLCVSIDDLHLDTYVFHLEKGNFEIWICTHWSQGYSPFGSYGKGGRPHMEI